MSSSWCEGPASPEAVPPRKAGPEKGEASQESPKTGELSQEPPKKGKTSPESLKKEEAKQEAPKKGESSQEPAKKGEAKQEPPKKGKTSPESLKKEEAEQEALKKGEASPEVSKKGETSQEAPKKPVFPFGKIPFRPHHWRLVTLLLGFCCLLLLSILFVLIAEYLHISATANRKMATLQRETQKLKDSVKQQAGGKDSTCATCLDDWVQRGDACYLFSKELATWTECIEYCKKQGAQLVKMDTQGELVFLKWHTSKLYNIQFRYRQYYNYWIGLIYKVDLAKWVWLDGTPFTLELSSVRPKVIARADICVFFIQGKSYIMDCTIKYRCLCKKTK
nr:natural killer cells antigen CD94-like [Pelodiscus sinensis]|eukprot:XP_025038791.1 natural killer cells antigen CD94-like [Pelodiscus sinensis]